MKYKEYTIVGDKKKIGDIAPNFFAVTKDLEEINLYDFKEKYIIINSHPTLEEKACSMQARKFNLEFAGKKDVRLITISNDLPFAQTRWCEVEKLNNATIVSDFLRNDFSMNFGVLLKEVRLLAKSLFVIDENRKIIFTEYINNQNEELNYDKLLKFMKNIK